MYSTQSTGYCCIKNPTLLALVSDMVEIKAKTSFPRSQSERKKALHLKRNAQGMPCSSSYLPGLEICKLRFINAKSV